MSKIAVIGTGYVGLTTGACFAHIGHDVVCADIDADKVARLQRGEIPILEAGLDNLVREGIAGRSPRASCSAPPTRSRDCEFAYLCVPTPAGRRRLGRPLLHRGRPPARSARSCPREAVVVNKSTVPVGSTRVVERALGRSDVAVVSNPEFLREGSAIHDFLHPDRIVIGAEDQAAAVRVPSLYLGITAPVIVTDPASAETIKYAANAFLATKISFINAVAAVCEAVGADIKDVALGMGYDTRIGHEFLKPGPGWGGSLLPQGHAGDGAHRRGRRLRLRPAQGRRHRQRRAAAPGGRQDRRPGRRLGRRQAHRRVGPHLQGPHRRPPRVAVAVDHRAPRGAGRRSCGPTTRPAPGRSRASRSSTTPTPPSRAPRCSPCSPSGTSSAGSTSTRWPT